MERLAEDAPTLVGIDHGFSFPLRYFETHGCCPTGRAFSTISIGIGRQTTTTQADRLRLLIVAGGHGAFVAAFRNRAEIVLGHLYP